MKKKILMASLLIGLVGLLLLGVGKFALLTHPVSETKEPFTIVCKVGDKEETFPAVRYVISNGACTFETDNGETIVVSDFAVFVNEPYYEKD